uniref:Ig-like domain-containing protein n=1 Tax=Vombatus ursinus TaxID=29139 RepID=A0A4X2LJC5_VOMUR
YSHRDIDPGLDLSPGNRTLTLEVVTRDDSGLYQCGARNPAVASISAPVTLKAIPVIIINSNNSYLVKFTCNPNEADVNIQWFLNNAELPLSPQLSLSSDNKILTFHNVTRGDSGYYQCKVWNSVGFQESDGINLIVFCELEINSSLTLKCQAESNPAPDYTWYLNENSLGILESQYSISMASRNHDGNYKCTVDNRLAGKSASASVTVKVAGESWRDRLA